MRSIARDEAERLGFGGTIDAVTGTDVPPIFLDAADLALGVQAVARILHAASASPDRPDAVIVAAFGDSGLALATELWPARAVGIDEAGLREAARRSTSTGGQGRSRPFAVVTTTPGHVDAIESRVRSLGLASDWLGIFLSAGEVTGLVADEAALRVAMQAATDRAVS